MAERRSLAAGIEDIGVDPEAARAFIVQERAKPAVKPPPVRLAPEPPAGSEPTAAEGDGGGDEQPAPSQARRPAKAARRPDTSRLLANLLVPVTVRLRPEVASALKRASLQRQLDG